MPAFCVNRLEEPFKKKLSQGYSAMLSIAYVLVGCAILATLIQCVLATMSGKQAPWGRLGLIAVVATIIVSMNVVKSFLGVNW